MRTRLKYTCDQSQVQKKWEGTRHRPALVRVGRWHKTTGPNTDCSKFFRQFSQTGFLRVCNPLSYPKSHTRKDK